MMPAPTAWSALGKGPHASFLYTARIALLACRDDVAESCRRPSATKLIAICVDATRDFSRFLGQSKRAPSLRATSLP